MNIESPLVKIIVEIIPSIIIALFGGFVELMLRAENTKVSAKFICSSLVVAAFVGMIVSLLMYDKDFSPAFQGAVVGVAGASARTIMEILKDKGSLIIRRFFDGS